MAVRTRFAELMLPVLLLPFMVPPLIGAVQVTARLLAGRPLSEMLGWLRLLALYDVVFVTLCTDGLRRGGGRVSGTAGRSRPWSGAGTAITVLALLALAGVYVLALGFTPIEARQGAAQKIFYLHVPAAWSALLAFSLVGICGGLYLWLNDRAARPVRRVLGRGGRRVRRWSC